MGYKYNPSQSSQGVASFYAMIPATALGRPDTDYCPTLLKGTEVASDDGVSFILAEDVYFDPNSDEVLVHRVDSSSGEPTYFAIKAYGKIISGQHATETHSIGSFKKFRRVTLSNSNIAEIISVVDSEGKEYFEVDNLSQDVIYKEFANREGNKKLTTSILKAVPVPRRFTFVRERDTAYLQFGFGSDSQLTTNAVVDPADSVLKLHGKDYFSSNSFDPSNLLETDKLGVGPSSVDLRVKCRVNTSEDVNAGSGAITTVLSTKVDFADPTILDTAKKDLVVNSFEVTNEEPIIGDVSLPTSEEIKLRATSNFSTQNRVVTKKDYVAYAYKMPTKFGTIKRCTVLQDKDPIKRNLNLYVISENADGKLVEANSVLKENLKTWISQAKMINDTVDILDAKVINLQVKFEIVTNDSVNRYDILDIAKQAVEEKLSMLPDIGEPFYITDIYHALNDVPEILDVVGVKVETLIGGRYSDASIDVDSYTSNDGRYIVMPENYMWEIKYPDIDIKGTIK
tara:strand:- start:113 stop:1648 length:1536 start_codon:yes stop_codon:yes gene_type:complete